ncbi:MAG: hypothetical protein M1561_04095 [Gammaproteobacteria bacterium]|nr:hypothetical protein [Gammaproteobacteria bacterium]
MSDVPKKRQDDKAEDKETTNKNNIPYVPLQGLPAVLPSDYKVYWEIECDDKKAEPALKIIKALEAKRQAMLVGGASRCYAYNTIAKKKHYPNDYDIVTTYGTESALKILLEQGFADAVIDKYDHNLIQIPSANADLYCRNSDTFDMGADARSRVLHICAMYTQVDFSCEPPRLKIYATSSAADDLVSLAHASHFFKVVTFTDDPEALFIGDPFRIAKVIKWIADFGVEIPQVYLTIKKHLKLLTPAGQIILQKKSKGKIKALSAEELEKRRFSLLLKLFAENSIEKRLFIFDAFARYGIWQMFFPRWDEISARQRIYNINGDPRFHGASMNAFFRGIVSDALRINSASRDEIILRFNLSHWESGEQRRSASASASVSSADSLSRVSDTPSPDSSDAPSPANTVIVFNSASSSLQSTPPQSLSPSQPVSPLSASTPVLSSLASPVPIPLAQPIAVLSENSSVAANIIVVPVSVVSVSPEVSVSASSPPMSSASASINAPVVSVSPEVSVSASSPPMSSASASINAPVRSISSEVSASASLSPPRVLATEAKTMENSKNTTSIPQVPTPKPLTKRERREAERKANEQQLQAQRDAFVREQEEKQKKRRQEIEENIKKKEAAEEAQRKRERDLETKSLAEQAEQRRIAEQKEKARVEAEFKARQQELEAKRLAKANEREQKARNRQKLKEDLKTLQASSTSVSLTVLSHSGGHQVINLGGGSTSCASVSPTTQAARKKYPLWLLLTMGLFFLVSTKEFLSRTNKYFAFDRNDKPDLLETLLWGFAALGALWPFYIDNGTEEEKSNEPKRKF